ncbi:Protein MCM10 [Gossypium australe]|uniref:Protein MCM10 n=1 Tax=Gossypium australe TaxID=47621 RepID=A0A5B6WEM2_9ROSI|nr:Protein MCM10 [Gossypium australe]
MNEWFIEYLRTNPVVQKPPPPAPQLVHDMPQGTEPVRTGKPPVDKFRKYGAEEFRPIVGDDPERAEFWLENTIRVLDKVSCTPTECLKCAVSLLKDIAYQWWNTITSVVPRENFTWEFFQIEFRKKLSKYAREWVPTEADMCKRFEEGLNEGIKLLIGILELREFVVLAD